MTTKLSSSRLPTYVGMALILATGIAGCSDGGNANKDDGGIIIVSPPPPPPPPALIEDTFGARFGTIFRMSANSEPVDPVQTDINSPVDPTIEPRRLRP